jgi:HAD superfamily hydrolase (TIGR01509 family)
VKFDAIIFDFDGVLLESESAHNRQIAEYLTSIGHPTTAEQSMANFMGLAGADFLGAIENWIGRALPGDFHDVHALADPRAIASSSRTDWITRHLDHLGLRDAFGDKIFSGREHVERGKPSPDIYLHAAEALGVDIRRCVILEDSPVGVTGAVASGGHVIGLCAGSHCAPDHADRLRVLGVQTIASDFDEVARLVF